MRAAGYDIVWTPHAELIHHESATRGADLAGEAQARFRNEVLHMRRRWGETLKQDPFFSPLFSLDHSDHQLASPPRRPPPWSAP